MAEPELKEIVVSASLGGKVQVVKYEYSEDYGFSMTQRYSVEDMSEAEAKKFRQEKLEDLTGHLSAACQKELDRLIKQRDELNH